MMCARGGDCAAVKGQRRWSFCSPVLSCPPEPCCNGQECRVDRENRIDHICVERESEKHQRDEAWALALPAPSWAYELIADVRTVQMLYSAPRAAGLRTCTCTCTCSAQVPGSYLDTCYIVFVLFAQGPVLRGLVFDRHASCSIATLVYMSALGCSAQVSSQLPNACDFLRHSTK